MPFECGLLAHLRTLDMLGHNGEHVLMRGYNDRYYISGETNHELKVLRVH